MRYEDRAGHKEANPAEQDLEKAAWCRQMVQHVWGAAPDPRADRENFVSYRRPAAKGGEL